MKQTTYMIRRTDADMLSTKVVEMVKSRAKTWYGCKEDAEVYPFTVGYLVSLLGQIAAQSPASLRELESAVNFLEKQ